MTSLDHAKTRQDLHPKLFGGSLPAHARHRLLEDEPHLVFVPTFRAYLHMRADVLRIL